MSKVKTDLKAKTNSELVIAGETVYSGLNGNPHITIEPAKLTSLQTDTDAFRTSITDAQVAREAAEQKTTLMNNKRKDLEALLTELGHTCNAASSDRAILETTGFEVYDPGKGTPIELTQVLNLSATEGDNEGEVDLQWDNVKGAQGYALQQTLDPNDPSKWENLPGVGRTSKTTIRNLTSGTRYWFRVRAVRGNDTGGWSDPAMKIAP